MNEIIKNVSVTPFLSKEVREGGGILIIKVAYNSVLDFGNFGRVGPI